MMIYDGKYKCCECGLIFTKQWDRDDPNDDYVKCPNGCDGFDFDEVEQ